MIKKIILFAAAVLVLLPTYAITSPAHAEDMVNAIMKEYAAQVRL